MNLCYFVQQTVTSIINVVLRSSCGQELPILQLNCVLEIHALILGLLSSPELQLLVAGPAGTSSLGTSPHLLHLLWVPSTPQVVPFI